MHRERELAHKILNCGAFLTPFEKKFLNRIPDILNEYGMLTTRQANLLNSLADKTHQTHSYNPKTIKHNVALLMFNDLALIAAQMTPADKTVFRKQLIAFKKYGPDDLDKNQLWRLYKKYRENITL